MTAKKKETINEELFGSVHQERGDYLLPQIVDYISKNKWIDPRPEYQRRLVWTDADKSKFLESLILNLPIPPLFLYERSYGEWEIMDGQQRSNAIVEFYTDKLKLTKLKRCPFLTGKRYSDCPSIVKKNFDRRRIQVTTVLAETGKLSDFDVRKEVFERLNTGGKPLRPQEIRNCLYAGKFCDLLDELSSLDQFTTMWKIPKHKLPKEYKQFPSELLKNATFSRMDDCELVLRYFALNNAKFFTGSVKRALDTCMEHYHSCDDNTLDKLRKQFKVSINFVYKLFGSDALLIEGKSTAYRQIYDALMSASTLHKDKTNKLQIKSSILIKKLNELKNDESKLEELISRHDNREAFKNRKEVVNDIILSCV